MTDPKETLRRALKAEYRIGPEWPAWKFPAGITSEQANEAIERIIRRSQA